jgi:hypothetical protein
MLELPDEHAIVLCRKLVILWEGIWLRFSCTGANVTE